MFTSVLAAITFPNVIIGLIGIAGGVWLIIKAFWLNHHLLFLAWVENKWGPGTGTNFYQFCGAGVCVFSLFVMLGYIDVAGAAFGNANINNNSPQTQQAVPVPNNGTKTRIAE